MKRGRLNAYVATDSGTSRKQEMTGRRVAVGDGASVCMRQRHPSSHPPPPLPPPRPPPRLPPPLPPPPPPLLSLLLSPPPSLPPPPPPQDVTREETASSPLTERWQLLLLVDAGHACLCVGRHEASHR